MIEFVGTLALYSAMLGTFGYGLGRVLAVDTVLDPVRGPLLRLIGGRRLPAIAEYEAMGVEPTNAELVWPTGPVRRWLVDGLTCISCESFWVMLAANWQLDVVDVPWKVDGFIVFGALGISGALARKFG